MTAPAIREDECGEAVTLPTGSEPELLVCNRRPHDGPWHWDKLDAMEWRPETRPCRINPDEPYEPAEPAEISR